jgi:hypothetical protein
MLQQANATYDFDLGFRFLPGINVLDNDQKTK